MDVSGSRIKEKRLAFRVNPPPIAMIQLMWDYQHLTKQENELYV